MRHDKKARRVWARRANRYYRLDRNGCVYYAGGHDELLNPEMIDGTGLVLVKPNDPREVTGVYKTMGPWPTAAEEVQALYAYCCAVGKPRKGAVVVPASFFSGCIEQSDENIAALRDVGAFWVKAACTGRE